MSTPALIALAVADLAFVAVIAFSVVRFGWRPATRAYPPRPPTPEVLERRFQSFRFGLINFGYCMHTAVDEHHLHLTPPRWLRWLGFGPISVPWEAITIVRRSRRGGPTTVRIGSLTVRGPSWCLDLAAPRTAEHGAGD